MSVCCLNCGEYFYVYPSYTSEFDDVHFCSLKCQNELVKKLAEEE
jgi:hypothetical protein